MVAMQLDSDLFDFAERQRAGTKARTEHPDTSKRAARELVASGRLGKAMLAALHLARSAPGSTAAELDATGKLQGRVRGDGAIRKRLSELRAGGYLRSGDPRVCRVTGRMAQTWWPVLKVEG